MQDVIALLRSLGNASFAEMDRTGWGRYGQRSLRIPGQPRRPPGRGQDRGASLGATHIRGIVVLPPPGSSGQWSGPGRLGVWPVCVTWGDPQGTPAVSSSAISKCQVWVACPLHRLTGRQCEKCRPTVRLRIPSRFQLLAATSAGWGALQASPRD